MNHPVCNLNDFLHIYGGIQPNPYGYLCIVVCYIPLTPGETLPPWNWTLQFVLEIVCCTQYQQRRLRHMKKMVPGGDGDSEWCQYLRQFSDQQRSHSVVIQKFFFLLDFIDFMWNQLLPNSSLKCWAYKIVKSDNSISQSHKLISQKLLVTENFLHFHTVWQRSSVLLIVTHRSKETEGVQRERFKAWY